MQGSMFQLFPTQSALIEFLAIVSTFLMFFGIWFGIKLLKFIKFDRLWTLSWLTFIAMLTLVLIRRFVSFVLGYPVLEHIVTIAASFAFFSFAFFIHKFFLRYTDGGYISRNYLRDRTRDVPRDKFRDGIRDPARDAIRDYHEDEKKSHPKENGENNNPDLKD